MLWIRYKTESGETRIGIRQGEDAIPVPREPLNLGSSMRAVIANYEHLSDWLENIDQQPVETEPWRLLAPVDHPQKILCVGLNYRAHALETGKQPPTEPVIFGKLPSSLIGPEDPIVLPTVSDQVDYEAELVVVVGKEAKYVSEADAPDHIFGYCCGHDVSSRDWQYHRSGGQWLLGKSFDTFAPLGPHIAHKSMIDNAEDLRIQMDLNGEIMQDSRTSDLIFSIPFLISHLSNVCTLMPGDLIYTGTPSGVGVARDPQRFLRAGDRCTVEIEKLGRLSNPVVAAQV